ncbi:GGDEF domain-containing protein [Alicyclobacillus sacchari]|uniref:GGDEF domain-containing protein n=1 Tax=Alicyclobacillus sacchari TaxID=392010 RepID=UPI0024E0D361|nr:GGDEF domain-containing protein [Alicyclobacillus sacchari]
MGNDFLPVQRDALTNLFSRSHFLYAVAQAMPNAPTVSILLVNLDRFRMVNEHFSYADGDMVLRETAQRISTAIPMSATASRLCADEFAVALTDVDKDGAEAVAERVRLAIAEPHHIAAQKSLSPPASVLRQDRIPRRPPSNCCAKRMQRFAVQSNWGATKCARIAQGLLVNCRRSWLKRCSDMPCAIATCRFIISQKCMPNRCRSSVRKPSVVGGIQNLATFHRMHLFPSPNRAI